MKNVELKIWEHPCECPHCKTTGTAETEDVEMSIVEDGPTTYFVRCPSCGTFIKIPTAAISPNVEKAARAKRG